MLLVRRHALHAREDQCIHVVSAALHLEIGGKFIKARTVP